ncbi:MAG: DUF3450 domain-containing protein [Beggiatoa sp.]|nr:DUF3450 domain-containing protein [Beggiatoa sp.]
MLGLTMFVLGSVLAAFGTASDAAGPLDAAIDTRVTTQKEAADSQERIDAVAEVTQAMLLDFQHVTAQTDELKIFDDQLERQVETQRKRLADFEQQLATVRETQREIVPSLLRMLETLHEFVARDAPFLVEERKARLASLKAMVDNPEVGLPERYRRIMEAYQVETEYGRTIEAYSGKLAQGGKPRTVDFLRAGRVALVYATLDGAETGYWDRGTREWKTLPREYGEPVKQALRVARKQSPPDLIRLPIAVAVAPDPADLKPAFPTAPGPASAAPPGAVPTEMAPGGPEIDGPAAVAPARVPVPPGPTPTPTASPPAPAAVEPAPPQVEKGEPEAREAAP